MKLFSTITLISFAFTTAFTQVLPKSLKKEIAKIDGYYVSGDYKKALASTEKALDFYQSQTSKEAEAKEGYYHILKGQIYLGLGKSTPDAHDEIKRGIDLSKNSGKESQAYILALNHATLGYIEYGYVNNALPLFKEATTYALKLGKEDLNNLLKRTEAKLLLAQGYFDNAYLAARSQTSNIKNSISKYYEYKDPKSGKVKKKKYKKPAYIRIKRELGNHLNLVGEILVAKGAYAKADSALKIAQKWIKENIGKSDIAYAENLFQFGLKSYDQKAYELALPFFNEASSVMLKAKYGYRYRFSGNRYYEITSKLMECNWHLNKDDDVRGKRNQYYSETKRYFDKGNVNRAKIDFLDIKKQIIKTNYLTAKDLLQEVVVKGLIPRDHPLYLTYLDLSRQVYSNLEEIKKAREAHSKKLRLLKKMIPEESPYYHRALIQNALFLVKYNNDYKEVDEIFNNSYQKVYLKEFHPTHVDYLPFANSYARLLELEEQYRESIVQLEKNYAVAERYYNYKKTDRLAIQATKLAKMHFQIGEMKEANKYKKVCDKVYYITNNKNAASKADYLIFLGHYHLLIGELGLAEKNFEEANKLLEEKEKEKKRKFRKDVDISDFTSLYLARGEYSKLENLLLKNVKYKEDVYGTDHRILLPTLNNLTKLYIKIGEYTKAGKTSQRAIKLAKGSYGENSLNTMNTLVIQAKLYAALGNYGEATKEFNKAVTKQTKFYGTDENIYVAESITGLAMSRLLNGDNGEEVYNLLIHSAKVAQDFNKGDVSQRSRNSPKYAEALKNLAYYHIETGNLTKALDLINNKVETIYESLYSSSDKNNENLAEVDLLKGEIHKKQGKYEQAIDNFEDAKNKYKAKFSKEHPEYVYALSKLGQIYYIQKDYDKAITTLNKTTTYYLSFIDNYFTWLSESEKNKFWRKIKDDFEFYNTLAVKYRNNKPELLKDAYNHTLATKALLLNSSIKLRQAIVSSNDQLLIDKFNEWISLREDLTAKLAYSDEQLKEQGEATKEELNKRITTLEKELSEESTAFSESNKRRKRKKYAVTWEHVKESLAEDEVAVEIIRYRYYTKTFSDSIIYAALIVTPTTKKTPELVLFPNGTALERKFIKYYRNTTKLELDDDISYNQFWAPLKTKIPDNKTIYLSVEGVFNEINLESLKNKNGKHVLDENNIILVSNTKDLLSKGDNSNKSFTLSDRAVLVGNPAFYAQNMNRKKHDNANRKQSIKQLPGAEKEIKLVSKFLSGKGWKTEEYVYQNASEDTIKKIESPRILHFATHGFFIEDEVSKDNVNAGLHQQRAVINPLLKSGLLMSHAGDIIENKGVYDFNSENGVLTAYEAMNLDLSNTEMVVLSACETGLGSVQIGEGVYGLQRAFIVAGAKTVIMSLFKVSDEVTMTLMDTFYHKWLESGDKRQAFIEAKKEIRNKYPERIHWGAFVMIGI